jgi:hypothetical protein
MVPYALITSFWTSLVDRTVVDTASPARTAQIAQKYSVVNSVYYILPYAPGELQMDSETEDCLYPCGGAI